MTDDHKSLQSISRVLAVFFIAGIVILFIFNLLENENEEEAVKKNAEMEVSICDSIFEPCYFKGIVLDFEEDPTWRSFFYVHFSITESKGLEHLDYCPLAYYNSTSKVLRLRVWKGEYQTTPQVFEGDSIHKKVNSTLISAYSRQSKQLIKSFKLFKY